jgi:uncharacterized protein (DUF433 family)
MTTVVSYPHIEEPVGEPARLRRVPRVRVAQLAMDYLAYGWGAEELCRQHPYLTPAEAHAVLAYYFEHREQIDGEIEAEWKRADREAAATAPSPLRLRLRANRAT